MAILCIESVAQIPMHFTSQLKCLTPAQSPGYLINSPDYLIDLIIYPLITGLSLILSFQPIKRHFFITRTHIWLSLISRIYPELLAH